MARLLFILIVVVACIVIYNAIINIISYYNQYTINVYDSSGNIIDTHIGTNVTVRGNSVSFKSSDKRHIIVTPNRIEIIQIKNV